MRILICGGRDYDDRCRLSKELHTFFGQRNLDYREVTVIHGAARGADTLAAAWCTANYVKQEQYPVLGSDWDTHGKKAGILRNIRMLGSKPNVVIAFPGGRGTEHMITIARRAKVEVICIGG